MISCSGRSKRGGFRLRGRKLPSGISEKYSWGSGSGVLTVLDLVGLSFLSFLVGVVKEDLLRRGRGVGTLPNSSVPLAVWVGLEVEVVRALEKMEGIGERKKKRRKDWSRLGRREKRPHSESRQRVLQHAPRTTGSGENVSVIAEWLRSIIKAQASCNAEKKIADYYDDQGS